MSSTNEGITLWYDANNKQCVLEKYLCRCTCTSCLRKNPRDVKILKANGKTSRWVWQELHAQVSYLDSYHSPLCGTRKEFQGNVWFMNPIHQKYTFTSDYFHTAVSIEVWPRNEYTDRRLQITITAQPKGKEVRLAVFLFTSWGGQGWGACKCSSS